MFLSVFQVIFCQCDAVLPHQKFVQTHFTQNQNNQTHKQLCNEKKHQQIMENLRQEGARPPVKNMCIPPPHYTTEDKT